MTTPTPETPTTESGAPTHTPKAKKIPLMEAFGPTIQGEGLLIGVRTTFLRFGLCDYKCTMCDSMHAVDPKQVSANAQWLTQREIFDTLMKLHDPNGERTCDWVTLSGGNPCVHDLIELVDLLNDAGVYIAVETQGTKFQNWLWGCDVVTVSPKSPGMGEKFEPEVFEEFMNQLTKGCDWNGVNIKVVCFSAADLEFARHINNYAKSWDLEHRMYISLGNPFPPGKDKLNSGFGLTVDTPTLRLGLLDEMVNLIDDYLALPDMRNVKILPQMHVLLYGNKQGV